MVHPMSDDSKKDFPVHVSVGQFQCCQSARLFPLSEKSNGFCRVFGAFFSFFHQTVCIKRLLDSTKSLFISCTVGTVLNSIRT
jgi:hypothetical protein